MIDEERSERRRHGWALALFGLIVLCNVGYIVNQTALGYDEAFLHTGRVEYSEVLGSTMSGALGLVLSWLRPRNPIGWLISLAGLCLAACDFGQAYGARALVIPEDNLPLGTLALSLSAPLWVPSVFIPASLLLVRYPTGRIDGRWPRRFDRATIVGFILVYVTYATSLESVTDQVEGYEPPLLLPTWFAGPFMILGIVLTVGGTLLILADAIRRVFRSEPRQRAALVLLLVTATTAALVIFAGPDEFGGSICYAATLVAIAVGVLRYQALGIEVVARRALLYAMLTGLVLLVFIGITTGLATLVPTGPTPQIVAAVLIAVGLAPARERLQALVDRMMYGERDDPAMTLRRLGASMDTAPSEGLLIAVVANLADTLRLDGAEVTGLDGGVVATWGQPTGSLTVPLSFAGENLGALRVGSRPGEPALSRADRQLLDTVTPLIAAVVHAVRLTDDLRAERNRVVEATQAERRRLRQELHDGLGPSLTGVGLGLEAAQARPLADDPATGELLGRLRTEVASSLEEIRRIIDDLRPGALDSTDLPTALRRRVEAARASGVDVQLEMDPLPTLPPEVETAVFRIVDEAVTNVVRHAAAPTCTVSVTVSAAVSAPVSATVPAPVSATPGELLRVRVVDDGAGGVAPRDGGVGLQSMRERAERIGGRFSVESLDPGTAVCADLPLPLHPADPSLLRARAVTVAGPNRHSSRPSPQQPGGPG